jgi:hypothetical protein
VPDTKKELSMVFATVEMLSLTRFAACFSSPCQEIREAWNRSMSCPLEADLGQIAIAP